MLKKPNFFIIGAPKCGTTSLIHYLSSHKDVCISNPKEPHYFLTDLPEYRSVDNIDSYLSCFPCEERNFLRVGEASTWYLYSKEAVSNILDFDSNAKIIVMLRNPVELFPSLYQQFIYDGDENAGSVGAAWNLQEARLKGKSIPENMIEPARLQYKDVCSLGSQLERVIARVPKDQLKIILFNDFVSDTKKTYDEVLEFLGLENDNKIDFPVFNERKEHKIKLISNILQSNKSIDTLVSILKKTFGIKRRIGLSNFIIQLNKKKINTSRNKLDGDLRTMLINEFADDVSKLEKILGFNLDQWKT